MTIKPGEQWGGLVPCPDDLALVADDADLHEMVNARRSAGVPIPPVGLRGGDLFAAVGGSPGTDRLVAGHEVAALPVDLVRLDLDRGRTVWCAVHAVAGGAGSGWWARRLGLYHGEVVALMNGEFLGVANVAPKAHPNDGRVDVVHVAASMPLRDRLAARRRLALGTHLPHPAITTRQARTGQVRLQRPVRVRVDGVEAGTTTTIGWTVEPDAYVVYV